MTRRRILLFALASALDAGEPAFWNRKEPSQWTTDEVDKLITKSPWAKEFTVSTPQSGAGSNRGGIGIPGAGRGGMGGGRRGAPSVDIRAAQYKGIVRWASAKPILDAVKTPLPQAFADHYVIGVSGIPVSAGKGEDFLDRIKGSTYLEPKGSASAQPGVGEETPVSAGQARTVLLGFSKSLLQLSLDDKEVTFTTQIGTIPVTVRFYLKEMIYRGSLAV